MGFTMDFIGLVNFYELPPQGRLILVPDGRTPPADLEKAGHHIDPHHASFLIQNEDVFDASRWWPSMEDQVLRGQRIRQFGILTPSTVIISGMTERQSRSAIFDDTNFENKIVRLRDINPAIRIVPSQAQTIAQIPIRQGVLSSRLIAKAIVAQLDVDYSGPVTITAFPDDGSPERALVLNPGTEIVLANISENFGAIDPDANHFRLYAQLDSDRNAAILDTGSPTDPVVDALAVPLLQSRHRYILHLGGLGNVPEAQCSIVGCCRCASQSAH